MLRSLCGVAHALELIATVSPQATPPEVELDQFGRPKRASRSKRRVTSLLFCAFLFLLLVVVQCLGTAHLPSWTGPIALDAVPIVMAIVDASDDIRNRPIK